MNNKTLKQTRIHGGFRLLSAASNQLIITSVLLGIMLFATFARVQAQGQIATPPPNVVVTVEPSDGANIFFLPVAADTANDQPKSLLALQLTLKNQGAAALHLNKVKVSFVGPPFAAASLYNTDFTVGANKTGTLGFSDEQNIKLSFPAPKFIKLELFFDNFNAPVAVSKPLVPYANKTPKGSYRFFAKPGDLRENEYWYGSAGAHAGGLQRFAYDMGVLGWDADKKEWSKFLPGKTGDKNEDYRIWNKPIYAMADGVVVSCLKDIPDNPKPGVKTSGGGGNNFWIQHGDEIVLYAHLKFGSVNENLCKPGAKVKEGDMLGRAGNSGNSSGPHTHIDAREEKKEVMSLPLLFRDLYVIERDSLAANHLDGPWVAVKGKGLPFGKNAIWPSTTKPGGIAPNAAEVAKHAIPAAEYQKTVNEIVAAGYRQVWVDGFEVNGKTYFNAIFRPTDSPNWASRHGLNAAQYQTEFEKLLKQGLLPEQVESYLEGNQIRYAAIFGKKGSADFKAYHGRTAAQHQELFDTYTKAGYLPINTSVVSTGGQLSYTVLYQKFNSVACEAKSFLTGAEYQNESEQNKKAGRQLVYLNAYTHAGGVRFSAIWRAGIPGAFVALHGLNGAEYQQEWEKQTAQKYLTRLVTGYDAGSSADFAALWRK